jgi:hypothetical protein
MKHRPLQLQLSKTAKFICIENKILSCTSRAQLTIAEPFLDFPLAITKNEETVAKSLSLSIYIYIHLLHQQKNGNTTKDNYGE